MSPLTDLLALGPEWYKKFLDRHPDIKVKISVRLEKCRAEALNPTLVNEFYDILHQLVTEYQIPPENIYNMDEKGIQLGVGAREAVLVDRAQRDAYSIASNDRELITILETIAADKTVLEPSTIFKAVRRNLEWSRVNPCNARCVSQLL